MLMRSSPASFIFFLSGVSRTGHHNHNGRSPTDQCAHVILIFFAGEGGCGRVVAAILGLSFVLRAPIRVARWRLPFA